MNGHVVAARMRRFGCDIVGGISDNAFIARIDEDFYVGVIAIPDDNADGQLKKQVSELEDSAIQKLEGVIVVKRDDLNLKHLWQLLKTSKRLHVVSVKGLSGLVDGMRAGETGKRLSAVAAEFHKRVKRVLMVMQSQKRSRRDGDSFDVASVHPVRGFRVSNDRRFTLGVLPCTKNEQRPSLSPIRRIRYLHNHTEGVSEVIMVVPQKPSAEWELEMRNNGADVVTIEALSLYLVRLFGGSDQERLETSSTPTALSPARTRAVRILANADNIILSAASVAGQLDELLESLREERRKQNNPDSEVSIALDAAIRKHEDIRAQVSSLELAAADLKKAKPTTKRVETAGEALERAFVKFLKDRGPKVIEKLVQGGGYASIICSFAIMLSFVGASPAVSAAIAAWVLTGRSPAGLLKALKSLGGH